MSTPLTDAINALTTYANSVTGASDTTLSDAVETLVDGYGGGGYDFSWADVTVITISANTVSNTQDARTFLNAESYDLILLMSELTANNQLVSFNSLGTFSFRYRNGNIVNVNVGPNYDAVLVEGTQYLAFNKKA